MFEEVYGRTAFWIIPVSLSLFSCTRGGESKPPGTQSTQLTSSVFFSGEDAAHSLLMDTRGPQDNGVIAPPGEDHHHSDEGTICGTDGSGCSIPPGSVSFRRTCGFHDIALFFEDAKRPIVSFETLLESVNPDETTTSETLVLGTINLTGMNIVHDASLKAKGQLNLDTLKNRVPQGWKEAQVQIKVCEDTEQTNRCYDKDFDRFLTVADQSFAAGHIPDDIVVDILINGNNVDWQVCETIYDPLALDLTGAGMGLIPAEKGPKFDIDANGNLVQTGWVGTKNVAFLVRDLNRNGIIDNGAEMFGSSTRLKSGDLARNGFEALKDLDEDGDGKFTPKDSAWKSVALWFDRNHNARTDRGELRSLDEFAIQSIDLNYIEIKEMDVFGNETRQRSLYHRLIEGVPTPFIINDLWFRIIR